MSVAKVTWTPPLISKPCLRGISWEKSSLPSFKFKRGIWKLPILVGKAIRAEKIVKRQMEIKTLCCLEKDMEKL